MATYSKLPPVERGATSMTFLSLDKLVILYFRNVSFLRRIKHTDRPKDTAADRPRLTACGMRGITEISVEQNKYVNEAAERSRRLPGDRRYRFAAFLLVFTAFSLL